MLIFLLIVIVVAGTIFAYRLIAPYMHVPVFAARSTNTADVPFDEEEEISLPTDDSFIKLDNLLLEKNKLIAKLQKDIESERAHRVEFDNVKVVMDQEILRLKDQIRQLKQSKEMEKSHA